MEDSLTKIKVGKHLIGMTGLRSVFEEVRSYNPLQEDKLKEHLIALAGESNYIANAATEEYSIALQREYHRHFGEPFEDEAHGLELVVLGPGCASCNDLYQKVLTAAAELKLPADIRHVTDLNEIAEYGPLPTPALLVNGTVVLTSSVPSIEKLRKLIAPE